MDKFLESYNLPILNEEGAENQNTWITTNEIKEVIKNIPANESPGPDGFIAEFYQSFQEEPTPVLHKLFQKIQEGRKLSRSFYDATIILIPKQGKDTTKKENYKPISLMNIDANISTKY